MSGIITGVEDERVIISVDEGAKAGEEIEVNVEYLNSTRGIYDIED